MKIQVLYLVLANVVIYSKATPNPYCEVPTCFDKSHTLCQHTDINPAAACGQGARAGLSDIEKTDILDFHNTIRQMIHNGEELPGLREPQPSGLPYKALKWDVDLEMSAQRWVNQCQIEEDTCRDMHDFPVGQNILLIENIANQDEMDFPLIVWYNQIENFEAAGSRIYNSRIGYINMTNEFTQMIWHDTEKIGCGGITFELQDNMAFFMACNYGPKGNIDGQKIY